jgi:hypothetical protein
MIDMAATFANIAVGISQQFGGPYFPGVVIDQTAPVMSGGSIVTPGAATERPCQIQIDRVTEAMRGSDGYTDGEVRFLILAATLAGSLTTDARLRVDAGPSAGMWLVSSAERDTMGTHWEGRARRG